MVGPFACIPDVVKDIVSALELELSLKREEVEVVLRYLFQESVTPVKRMPGGCGSSYDQGTCFLYL